MTTFHFLLVEDDPIDCELIEATLKNSTIESTIVCVNNRHEFIDNLKTKHFDLILADYALPTFNGLEALDLAKKMCPDVPFILISGVLGEEQAIEALKQGATDYVLKQRLQRLLAVVKRALRERQERQNYERVTQDLRKTDNLLHAIVDASPVGIITFDQEQRVLTWNTAAERIYGWTASTLIGQGLPVIPESQQERFRTCLARVLGNQTVLDHEFQHLCQNNNVIDVSVSLAPLYNEDDQIYGVVMTTANITARKRIETERKRTTAALKQQADELASANQQLTEAKQNLERRNRDLRQFAYVISHDLKAPLRAIDNLSEWIEEDLSTLLPEESKAQMTLLRQRVKRLESLINGLLELARVGQVNTPIEDVDLNALLLDVVNLLAPSKNVTIHVQGNLPQLRGRRVLLQQVFSNLISNAIKHSGRDDVAISVSATRQERHYEFAVGDNGQGIAPEYHQRIFGIFQTLEARDTTENTGVGLSLVKRIVTMEGGDVSVESQVGSGATFRFTWPLSPNFS